MATKEKAVVKEVKEVVQPNECTNCGHKGDTGTKCAMYDKKPECIVKRNSSCKYYVK